MNNHTDLRIQKTYIALYNALLSLLEEKGFEEITVNELCARALVGRGTFYKHFADKYEFIYFVAREHYRSFLDNMHCDSENDTLADYSLGLFRNFIDFCEQSPGVISNLQGSKSIYLVAEVVSEILVPEIAKRIEQDQSNGHSVPFDPTLFAQLICTVLIQTVLWWFLNRDRISKDDLLSQFSLMLPLFFRTD